MMMKQPTATNQSASPSNGNNNATKSSVAQSNEGRETIIPLRQRSILHRLDVYPFLIGYTLLIFGDGLLLHSSTNDGNFSSSTVPIIAMDVGFILLLILQLGLFLKCAWDPIWYAKVAYYWLLNGGGGGGNDNNNCNNNGSSSSKKDGDDSVQWKIEQMKQWTHCLVIPPPPFDNSSNNNKQSGVATRTSSSQVARSTERPGITPLVIEYQSNNESGEEDAGEVSSMVAVIPSFRGWTYRCCCNIIGNSSGGVEKIGVHTDLPMESIWYKESTGLKEIDDDDVHVSPSIASPSSSSSSSSTSWQPQFHRLHFPIDLALTFYIHTWKGHTTSHSITQTRSIYGPNATLIPLPPYISLLTEQLLQPLFLFQLFCVLLWSLDEYWIYALFTLGSIVMFECIQALNRWKSVKRLREEVVGGSGDGMNKKQEMVECYRLGEWMSVPTDELVAGDVISLISPSIHNNQKKGRKANTVIRKNAHDHNKGNTIPADLLLLNGRAVVNEAMLTGESVPQVKESIGGEVPEDNGGGECVQKLDLSEGSTHKRCVLFGGTVLMDHHSEEESGGDASSTTVNNSIPSPPNDGIVCFVLRTGFDTIQGQLLRTMAYHAEGGGNSGGSEGVDSKETFYFLLILLLCALVSAASVVDEAWGDVTRNHFKLVLHVIIIITSVIPPELPMELSLAVTTSLSELIKRFGIYCTEPFRIPLAGLVDTCCFDKTGTLTSDELRLHGVRLPSSQMGNSDICGDDDDLVLLDRSLSEQNDRSDDNEDSSRDATIRSLLPHETLRVMVGCQSLAVTHAFVPGRDGRTTVSTELCGDPLEKAVLEGCGFTIHPSKNEIVEKESLMGVPSSSDGSYSMSILHRFAFSSKLRRMTTLAIENKDASSGMNATLWALTKGAPEAIQSMLDPTSLPSDYEESYLRHMKLGRRVLALAYRDLGSLNNLSQWKASRGKVEQNLQFAGLLIMDCPLKFDSKRVVKELRAGQQKVVMVTGDALLTAVEVARRVGIVDAPQEFTYALSKTDVGNFVFQPIGGGKNEATENCLSYSVSTIAKLRKKVGEGKAAVCITGDMLAKLAVSAIERASPEKGSLVIDERIALNHPAARTELALMAPIVSVFARHAPRHKEAVIAAFNASGSHTLMCGDGTNDVGALKQAHVGVSIISVPDLEAKQRSANETISAVRAEDKKERKSSKKRSKSGSKSSGKKPKQSRAERIERSLQALAEAEEELHYVSLGNASVASPFTSRKTSIRCCKDILQQGRCTLVTMIQIYKILGVNCLVNALVLTKLHQKGVKQGDRQMTAVGLVVAGLFLFVTRGKPLSKISPCKPPSSVLCKETLLSMTVQFAIHFVAIMTVTYMSDVYVDPYDPSAMVPDGPFNPNTLNTATFLVTVLATINTFVVNYRGRPFMENLTENKLLFRSLQACYAVLFVCALDIFPPLNQLLQLTPLPSTGPPSFNVNHVGQGGDVDSIQGMMLQAIDAIGFRLMLCVIMCLDTAFVTLSEKAIRSVMDG